MTTMMTGATSARLTIVTLSVLSTTQYSNYKQLIFYGTDK
jgi:hypothetical protein